MIYFILQSFYAETQLFVDDITNILGTFYPSATLAIYILAVGTYN